MILVEAVLLGLVVLAGLRHSNGLAWGALVLFAVGAVGFFVVQPNEARVLTLFGRYAGSVRRSGLYCTNPFTRRQRVSLRIRNLASGVLKVNDQAGNPVEIGAVVVWRVVDSARALFDVDDYAAFVGVQAETALRALAGRYPYDSATAPVTLLGSQDEIAADLRQELADRLAVAGVEVAEARLSHLAYAPEIAQAMLRRQQAQAVVAARKTIVEGAVGMVELALNGIARAGLVELDDERKATMDNNLMVVLTADQATQPVVNTGTLCT